MSYVRITSNADAIVRDLQSKVGELAGHGVRGSVSNDTPYAIYCEFGTYRMLPHAMVRNSIPNIEARLEKRLDAIKDPTANKIKNTINNVLKYALAQIESRTHVDTGLLKSSWKINEAEII